MPPFTIILCNDEQIMSRQVKKGFYNQRLHCDAKCRTNSLGVQSTLVLVGDVVGQDPRLSSSQARAKNPHQTGI